MLEEEFIVDNSDNFNENSESQNQVDEFPKTTKLLDRENLKDKKDIILTILKDNKLQTLFENNSEFRRKCVGDLLECKKDETEIKGIISKNLPDGYAYDVSTGSIVENQVNVSNNNFSVATTTDRDVNQAQVDVNQAQVDVNQAQVDVNQSEEYKKNVEEEKKKAEIIQNSRIAKEKRDELIVKYEGLKGKTDKSSDLYNEVEKKLKESGAIIQLEEIGKSIKDSSFVENYILVQATLLELKSNPTTYEEADISYFDKIVKNLNNACNIPDTNLSSFSPDNIAQTRTELFNEDIGNDSLRQIRESNTESHKEVYNEMFPEEVGEEDLISNYGNFLQGELKQFFEKFVNNIGGVKDKIEEIKKNDNPTEEDKRLLQIYNYMIAELDKNRREVEEQTKKLMEEMCIISQIKGMSMCIGQEEGKDFNLNKANEIINDNGVLTLKGHIDGVDFSVSHDTIKPNQHLKIRSKLGVDSEDPNTFIIGGEKNYIDSPFILPSQEEIFGVITNVVQSNNDLSKSSDLPKYLEGLQNNIIGTMDEVYKGAELAHHYVTNKVKGEKIVYNSLAMINSIKPNMDDLTKPINQGSNEKLFSFLKMIKFNVENSDTEEKNKLNQCMARIPEIIDAYKATGGTQNFAELKYPPIIENYLKNQAWLENGNEDSKLGLVFDMLSYYNQNSNDTRTNKESNDGVSSKIVINDLYRDLFEFSNNGQSEVGTKRKNENQEKQDKQEAEDVLALNDESIWPPVEYG